MKKTVYINGEPEEVDVKPITLFYGYDFKLDVPDAIVIDTRNTFEIAKNLNETDLKAANSSGVFRNCFNTVFLDEHIQMPKDLASFRGEGSGVQAVFVLVMLLLNSIAQNAELWRKGELIINVKYPETCLHPREQANLGDLLIKLSSPDSFRQHQSDLGFDNY